MLFEWDEAKNTANFKKHEIWFEEAQTVWTDPLSQEFFDPDHSQAEERLIRIGHSAEKVIRIISARRATAKERKEYESGI